MAENTENKDRKNMFKWKAGWERLRNIVRGYDHNIWGKVHYDGTLSDYPAHAEIEFPLQLLKDIHEKGDFTDDIKDEQDYLILEQHGLPKNFDLDELIGYSYGYKRMEDLEGWYIDKIEKVEIRGGRVHLDVLVREVDEHLV